jgi:hypothetical protein
MKRISKRLISVILALIMAMPMVFAMPGTANAESTRANTEESVLFWDFTDGANVNTDDGRYTYAALSRVGKSNSKLKFVDYNSKYHAYNGTYNGLTSENGFVYYEGLADALDTTKDVKIEFRLDLGDHVSGNDLTNYGVFGIGSARGANNSSGETSFNDVCYMKNNGEVYYRGDGGSRTINTSSATALTTSTKYTFQVYYEASTHKLTVKKDGTVIAELEDTANLTVDDFNFFAVSVWQNTYYGNTTIEYIEVSQPIDYASVATTSITSQSSYHAGDVVMISDDVSGDGKVDSNVLYAQTVGTENTSFFDSNATEIGSTSTLNIKFFVPAERIVYLYTGDTSKIKIPVVSEIKANSSVSRFGISYIAPDNADWKNTSNWLKNGTNEPWRQWNRNNPSSSYDGTTNISFDTNNAFTDFTDSNKGSIGTDSEVYVSNFIYYNKSISDDQYSVDIAAPTFKGAFKSTYTSTGCNATTTHYNNQSFTNINLGVGKGFNFTYRALNYTQINTAIATITGNDFKTLFNKVKNNGWMYTKESRDEFLKGVAMVARFNLTNYDFSQDAGVKAAAADMAAAVAQFNAHKTEPTLATYTATFKDANGDEIDEYQITAGDALGALPENTAGATSNGAGKHTVYTWDGVADAADVIQEDTEYTETTKEVDCTLADNHVEATDDLNGYTNQKCSVCGYEDDSNRVYDLQDFKAYDDAMDDYDAVKGADNYTAKYTADSRTAYENAVNDAKIDKTNATLSPKAIANAAKEITDAKGNLGIASYTITYSDGEGTTSTETYEYGTSASVVEANAPAVHVMTNDATNHYTYAWGDFADVTGAATYTQTKTATAHTYADVHREATDDCNGYTDKKCSVCEYVDETQRAYDLQDFSAYNTAIGNYNTVIGADDYAAKYTADSRTAYQDAVTAAQIDTSDATLSPKQIANAAAEVAAAASNLVVAEYTITYINGNNDETTAGFAYGTEASVVEAAAPALSDSYHDATNHYTYGWNTDFADVTGAATYTQTATPAVHTYADVHREATDDCNGYTDKKCSVCEYVDETQRAYDLQDFTAYTNALANYNAVITGADYSKYTSLSREAYEKAVDDAKINTSDVTLSPKQIADAAAEINNAFALLAEPEAENKYNLTLDDGIDVNFYLETDYYEEQEAKKVTISYITTSDEESGTRATEEIDFDAIGTIGSGEDTYSKVTMNAAPAQIAEPYVIEVYDENDVLIDRIETSIVDYCDKVIAAPLSAVPGPGAITAEAKEVARGLLDYGAAADTYFGYGDISETANYAVHQSDNHDEYMAAFDAENIKAKAKANLPDGVVLGNYVQGNDASGNPIYVTNVAYVALLDP